MLLLLFERIAWGGWGAEEEVAGEYIRFNNCLEFGRKLMIAFRMFQQGQSDADNCLSERPCSPADCSPDIAAEPRSHCTLTG